MANQEQTLWGLIAQRARHTPDQRFSLDENGRELSFTEFEQSVLRCAQGFYELGIRAEDRVAWQLPTWTDSVILAAALNRLGAVQVPLFPTLRVNEVSYICEIAKPKLLLTPSNWKAFDYAAMAAEVQERVPGLAHRVLDQGGLPDAEPNLEQLGSGVEATNTLPVRWIFCTSGTTSQPKAALHTDTPFVAVGYGMNAALENSSSDVIPMFFPFTHVGGLMWLCSSLLAGSQLLFAEQFNPASIKFAHDHGATIGGSGTAFHMAYLNVAKEMDEPLFPEIRSFPGGGAPKPPELHYQMKEHFSSAGIISGYGLTECPIISMNTVRDPDQKLADTEGRLMPGMEVRIIRPDGSLAPNGEEGEIRVRGSHLCVGFLDEALTKKAFDADGFFSTGDIGFLDEGGWLTISGRLKDVIIRKGENISAKKIEDLLYQHEAVSDVAVVGVPDAERGEMAVAAVQLEKDATLAFADMQAFCLSRGLVIQEVPERLEILDELPRNLSGKILKNKLQEMFS
jgi:acyl-CoA synthetase (AMP-forming)/AMP-acid ligase II